jgi:hypothetical protein
MYSSTLHPGKRSRYFERRIERFAVKWLKSCEQQFSLHRGSSKNGHADLSGDCGH